MDKQNKKQLQAKALVDLVNIVLLPPADSEIENSKEVESLLQQTKDANQRLQKMLSAVTTTGKKARVKNSARCNVQDQDLNFFSYFMKSTSKKSLSKRARAFFMSSEVPSQIERLVNTGKLAVRTEVKVASNLGIQATLCTVLLSFQPVWLKLALETIFDTEIDFSQCTEEKFKYARVISSFVVHNLFADFSLVEHDKRYVIGRRKRLLTPAGLDIVHKNFLSKFLMVLYLVENFVTADFIRNIPCMFWCSSGLKSIGDVFAILSREVLSGTSSIKSLQQIGFHVTYRQGFFEEYHYVVNNFHTDFCDGIILAKLVEILSAKSGKTLNVVERLRNPNGDRLRKIYNVRCALTECTSQFQSQFQNTTFQADDIVAAKYDVLVDVLWKILGIFFGDEIVDIRNEFMDNSVRGPSYKITTENRIADLPYRIEMKRLNEAATRIQKWWRRRPVSCAYQEREICDVRNEFVDTSIRVPLCTTENRIADLPYRIEMKRLNEAATRIQKWWRQRLVFRVYQGGEILDMGNELVDTSIHEPRCSTTTENHIEIEAVTRIQKWWRQRLVFRAYQEGEIFNVRNEFMYNSVRGPSYEITTENRIADLPYRIEMKRLNEAATRIQKWWRRRPVSCAYQEREICDVRNEFVDTSIRVPLCTTENRIADLPYRIEMKRLNEAATRIQKWWRQRLVFRVYQEGEIFNVRNEFVDTSIHAPPCTTENRIADLPYRIEMKRLNEAATRIQKWWRQRLVFRVYQTDFKLLSELREQALRITEKTVKYRHMVPKLVKRTPLATLPTNSSFDFGSYEQFKQQIDTKRAKAKILMLRKFSDSMNCRVNRNSTS